jgi:hypothetical protein
MSIGKTRIDRCTVQIDDPGRWSDQRFRFRIRSHKQYPAIADGERSYKRTGVVDSVYATVGENEIGCLRA